MKALLPFLLFGALVTAPFYFLRKPWAVKLWRRAGLGLFIYVAVIFALALMTIVLHWHSIYG